MNNDIIGAALGVFGAVMAVALKLLFNKAQQIHVLVNSRATEQTKAIELQGKLITSQADTITALQSASIEMVATITRLERLLSPTAALTPVVVAPVAPVVVAPVAPTAEP